ncbi:MAG TPA: cation diffusion facilitator family transporter [Thermoplasmata archaeon]|nr:cation diffusion facilitator family transporter [Thermoplasmata archaeon]
MAELHHGEGESEQRVLSGLRLALELSVVVLVIEAVGAWYSRSLAVTADAVHNIPDIAAFAVSWAALRSTSAGATDSYTFGRHRFEVFAGLFNGALILGTGLLFGYEGTSVLVAGTGFGGPVVPIWILAVALPTLGLRAVSLANLGRLPRRARDLNLWGVLLHLASDLAITGALVVAGVVLLVRPAWGAADAVAAVAIAAILVYESLPLFRDGWEVLTERTPRTLSIDAIARTAREVPHVAEVHDLHVWSVCPTLVCMTAHVRVDNTSIREGMEVAAELRRRLARDHGILHAVIEVEAAAP